MWHAWLVTDCFKVDIKFRSRFQSICGNLERGEIIFSFVALTLHCCRIIFMKCISHGPEITKLKLFKHFKFQYYILFRSNLNRLFYHARFSVLNIH
jgi:hypothetical protein